MSRPRPEHLPEILKVHGQHQWQTACRVCGVLSTDVVRALATDVAMAHLREHHPDVAPPVEPPNPEHGKAPGVRYAYTGHLRTACHCGLRWTGTDALANAALADHLAKVAPAPAPAPALPADVQIPRRIR